jgi:hypothetical protein
MVFLLFSEDFIIPWLTAAPENAGSAGILPAAPGHRALDNVAGRMPALLFSWLWYCQKLCSFNPPTC